MVPRRDLPLMKFARFLASWGFCGHGAKARSVPREVFCRRGLGLCGAPRSGREPRLLFEGLGEGGLLRVAGAFGDLPHGK